MKNQLARILIAAGIFLLCLSFMPGCKPTSPSPGGATPTASPSFTLTPFEEAAITGGASVGVSIYLNTIGDSTKCHAIANLVSGIAGTLRTFTGNPPPTPDQLTAAIIAQIPQNLQTQYPEVTAIVVPLVVQGYNLAIAKYGSSDQQTVYKILNDVATGVQSGAAAGCR